MPRRRRWRPWYCYRIIGNNMSDDRRDPFYRRVVCARHPVPISNICYTAKNIAHIIGWNSISFDHIVQCNKQMNLPFIYYYFRSNATRNMQTMAHLYTMFICSKLKSPSMFIWNIVWLIHYNVLPFSIYSVPSETFMSTISWCYRQLLWYCFYVINDFVYYCFAVKVFLISTNIYNRASFYQELSFVFTLWNDAGLWIFVLYSL